jgi:hypothetical protein
MENSKFSGRTRAEKIIDLIKIVEKPGLDDTVGKVSLSKEKGAFQVTDLTFEGSSILKDGKLIGWLTPDETLATLIIKDKLSHFPLTISDPIFESKKVTVEIQSVKTKIKTEVEEAQPSFKLDIDMIGYVAEIQGEPYEIKPEYWAALEDAVEKATKILVKDTLESAQNQYHSDFFGFCEELRIKEFKTWKKNIGSWDNVFQNCPIEVDAKAVLRRPSIIKQPIQLREKGE